MKEFETNINMDTTKCRARSCDASNITVQESQWNLQMFTPIIKQETVHLDVEEIPPYMDEDETFCNGYMSLSKPLQTSERVEYSDSKLYMLEKVKKEFPEDEYPQPDHNRSGRLDFENKEFLQVIVKQEFKQEQSEENLSLIKNEEIDDIKYPFLVKIENLEEHRVLDNFEDSGVHYDVLVAPEQVQCKLCYKTFKNRYTLLIHNNEHIIVAMYPTPVDIEMNELQEYNCCNEYFNSHDNMLAPVRDVHSNKRHKSELYHEVTKPYLSKKNSEKLEYKCDLCERLYKSKTALVEHTKKIHVDYGRMFECWCGKQFRSPIYLSLHKRQHRADVKNINNKKFKCDSCHKLFKTNWYLNRHIMSVHYDYGKTFQCSCGEQFRTPIHLSVHKKRQHNPNVKTSNIQFQCDYCHKLFKTKVHLIRHIKRIHYHYGKIFECSCGKQFRTPIYLSLHKKRQHNLNVDSINNRKFQCDSCHKFFKTKVLLIRHIQRMHYDYGKAFECSCGKQFRTPVNLSLHKKRQHGLDDKIMNNERFPCDSCHKLFKTEKHLANHVKRIHYEYGKTFECSCGKQFRTPIHLNQHKRRLHCADVKIISN